jgi:hypothetical protein
VVEDPDMKVSTLLLSALLVLGACGGTETIGTDSHRPDDPGPQPEPPVGSTEFVSADGRAGQETQENRGANNGDEPAAEADGADQDDERTVEEGDIYRVLDGDRILNLNSFRGLQIVNFQDVDQPFIEGRAAMTGYPVEMYVVDNHAYVLLNNWRGYWRSRHDTRPEQYTGGLLVSVNIEDPTNPYIVAKERIPGYVRTSRLTRSNQGIALYAAASWYGAYEDEFGDSVQGSFTYVKSFHLTDGTIQPKSEINLGGYVGDIQATTSALIVSRIDWNNREPRSRIALIDITDPEGTMVEGDEVEVRGYVANKYNMDLDGDVLRVVSGAAWGNFRTNHLQTYDASNFSRLIEIDHVTFGDNENLFATLFLGEKAFCVTYRQVDPFHAFHISPEGIITEKTEYIISGFNTYFRAIEGGDRLLGIGIDDEEGRTLAVSLYDTSLENPTPFIERKHVDADWSWGESQWDDRAFSVIENAVNVEGPNGARETGLVLLPYSGWDRDNDRYIAAVQIFTFSRDTLTQRGSMNHGSPVRRSFLSGETTTTNMSEISMSFFDTSNPDEPSEHGRVELAPNYTDYWVFGDYGARLKNGRGYYWWYRNFEELPDNSVDIVPLSEDPDLAQPVATIQVPPTAQLSRVGNLLLSIDMRPVNRDNQRRSQEFQTDIHIFDLSDPANPRTRGSLSTRRLRPNYYYYGYYGGDDDCWDCNWWGYTQLDVREVDNALVFPRSVPERRHLGTEEYCNTYPTNRRHYDCWDEDGPQECTYYTGSRRCRSLNDGPAHCTGSLYRCTQDNEGQTECEEIEEENVATETHCYEREAYRYWRHFDLDVVDLSDPDNPTLADRVTMPMGEEGVSVRHFSGSDVYVNYKVPAALDDDIRPFVRYYTKKVDLSNPSSPQVERGINVPGEVIQTANDGAVLFTKDTV